MNKILISIAAMFVMSNVSFAAESTMEKAETVKNKTADATARTYRAGKDQACETFNEKGECASQKMKHKAQNLKDKTATKATETKNKVN